MHGELMNNVIVSIDDAEMDTENENNLSINISNQPSASSMVQAYNPNFEINNSSIDLDMYVSGYSGLMRIFRLIFLAEHCPTLRIDTLKLALNYVMETHNTQLYSSVHKQLTDAANKSTCQSVSIPSYDSNWVDTTNKKGAMKLEKLDTDLKSAKSLAFKDCIRRGQEDLADHFLDMGDLTNALKCYCRSRDYCSNNKNITNLCLNVIKVSVLMQNWSNVLSYVSKVETTMEAAGLGTETNKEEMSLLCKVKCAAGLAELNSKRYKSAAKCFLAAHIDNFNYYEIMTPNNVATYGALCALATYDRRELQTHVIQSSSFKSFLELEPQIREILFKFNESKYAICLKLMDQMKDYLMLDMYISPHVDTLYAWIRQRALRQYFSPYKSADLRRMSAAFNTSTGALEEELIQLILDGQIQARIDSQNKILYAKDVDQRSFTFERSLQMGKEYQKRTKSVILRSLLLKYNISVRQAPNQQQVQSSDQQSIGCK
ncbi:COP9 signalosome complex subunit 1 [Brachionus plicatilis]|uniref:COP9 signalosome complex subunit 1 n=1 Tax=Brachionus plicatilis TaxID=10195 RepID=A0A3M7RGD9_BRAPC|nr:COP9 signalosome complex subunit 1 [Brachionus plicatilis]